MSTVSLPSISDYREAVQNPHLFLDDQELKRCRPAWDPRQHLPKIWPGNFAAVFQLQSPDGSKFAIKCFYRDLSNLQRRYAALDNHLRNRCPGYLVSFRYQPRGILVNGQWFPIVRMEWVEGQRLDEFLQHHLQRPGPQTRELLKAVAQLWHRLAGELERDRLAHGDLQHGNVLLLPENGPNRLKLQLVDYDGVWVPALDTLPSNESGQPNYQHPQRRYGPLMDRFPHLVIYTTLRCLMLDHQLVQRFSEESLLFSSNDFAQPGRSQLFRELWKNCRELNTRNLVGHLILACVQPFEQTPRLQELVPDAATGQVRPLTALQQGRVEEVLRNGSLSPQSSATSVSFASTGPKRPSVSHPIAPGLKMLLTGHEDRVECVAVTSDGRYVLSGSDDTTVRVWDLATGQEVRRFTGHAGWVNSIAVTPDGQYIVSGSGDKTVRLWDLATGQEVRQFTGHRDSVVSVAVTPDGRYAVSGGGDNTVRLWDLETGQEVRLGAKPEWGKAFLTHLWEMVTFTIKSAAEDLDSWTFLKRLWELATRKEVRGFTGHAGWVWSVAVTPDGRYVVSGSEDNTVRLWDLETGQEVLQFIAHEWKVYSVAVTPDGRYVVSGSRDKTVRLWELATGQEVRRFTVHKGIVRSIAVTPDGKYVVSGSGDRTVRLWDLATGKEVRRFTGHAGTVRSVAVTPDGRYVVSGSEDKTIRVWYIGDLK
jgi:WD40 repeat protein